jgi:alkylation response protein AidB-like acyl-CoA dehydrogenase
VLVCGENGLRPATSDEKAAFNAMPPPPPPPAIRKITLAAFLARITPTEYAGMSATPMLGYALACQTAETNPSVNLDSERLTPLLMLAVQAGILTIARVQDLRRDGTPDEAA